MSSHEEQIKEGAASFLEPGEQILAAVVASPRGSTTGGAGGAAGLIGGQWAGKNASGAKAAGLVVKRSCGLALTPSRIVTFDLGISMMGAVKEVKSVLSSVPLAEIESVEGKRFGAGGVITITAQGGTFKLESKAAGAKEFAEAFDRAKA
jgi:hypothetical protein